MIESNLMQPSMLSDQGMQIQYVMYACRGLLQEILHPVICKFDALTVASVIISKVQQSLSGSSTFSMWCLLAGV